MMPKSLRKDDANYGGKIFLPPSSLNRLTMLNIRYPMLFELFNEDKNVKTHSGVLEFVAEEGRVYIPQWMMDTLQLHPGSIIKISNQDNIPLGKFVKIEPQSTDFLDISDPKAVLENVLRKFSTLTINDIIEVNYNEKVFGIKVLEVKPESPYKGICVIETDLETDFAPPVGYVEPDYKARAKKNQEFEEAKRLNPSRTLGTMAKSINYAELSQGANQETKFKGEGGKLSNRISKVKKQEKLEPEEIKINLDKDPVPLSLPDGQLFFGFPLVPVKLEDVEGSTNTSQVQQSFQGQGQSLRSKKRKDQTYAQSPKQKVHSPEVIEID